MEGYFDAPDGLCTQEEITSRAPDLAAVRVSRRDQSPSLFGPGVLEVCRLADAVFLGLHGECGEDGRVQAAFDLEVRCTDLYALAYPDLGQSGPEGEYAVGPVMG